MYSFRSANRARRVGHGKAVDILDPGVVIAARDRDRQRLPHMHRIGRVETDSIRDAVQIDARIDGHAVAVRAAVLKAVDRRNRDAVGIEISELSRLLIGQTAAVPRRLRT